MSLSTLTAFDYIAENSLATPGLFNRIFSQLSDNIGTVNQAGINPAQLSGSTWASIGLQANSSNSDYIRMVDSSGQRSTYILGSKVGGTADGLNLYDESGSTMLVSFSKQSIRFYQTVVGPVFDVGGALTSTLNAGTFGTASDSSESRIQAAITQAAQQHIERVYVPANMYPYSASSVSFIQTVHMVREGGDWVNYDVQAYGASPTTQFDSTFAFRAAFSGASGSGHVTIPLGNYSVTSLILDGGTQVSVKGASRDGTVIYQASGTTAFMFHFAPLVPIEGIDVQDLTLRGASTGLGGIKLGNSALTYTAFIRLENLIIRDFSATSATGLYCAAVQELAVNNCKIFGNYYNIYRPSEGYMTATAIRGQKGYCGSSTSLGVFLNGVATDISILEQTFESNAYGAIYASGYASNIIISDCYFEGNISAGTAGTGVITVTGASGVANQAQLRLRRNHFHINDAANPNGKQLRLDYVWNSVVAENSGLQSGTGISTTANTQCHFEDNADAASSGDYLGTYRALTNAATAVTGTETDVNGNRTEYGNRRFDDLHFKSSQLTAPTIAVQSQAGTSATAALDANATDLKGEITVVTGSGAWSAGPLALLTFNRTYAAVPQVQLSPRNNNAGAAWGNNGTFTNYADAAGFYLQFASAATVAKTYIWSYFVVQ